MKPPNLSKELIAKGRLTVDETQATSVRAKAQRKWKTAESPEEQSDDVYATKARCERLEDKLDPATQRTFKNRRIIFPDNAVTTL